MHSNVWGVSVIAVCLPHISVMVGLLILLAAFIAKCSCKVCGPTQVAPETPSEKVFTRITMSLRLVSTNDAGLVFHKTFRTYYA